VLDERSLADAGFSEDQECLGLTIGRPVQYLSDRSKLSFAASESFPERLGTGSHKSSSHRTKAAPHRFTDPGSKPQGFRRDLRGLVSDLHVAPDSSVEVSDLTSQGDLGFLAGE